MKATTARPGTVRMGAAGATGSRWRTNMFAAGDCLFLVLVGVVSTLVMHAMHQLGWNFAVTCVVGMVAAMLVQMLMAFLAAPLLGSIETMTPSMIVGMISPMSVCTLHLFGHEPDHAMAIGGGAIFGLAVFVFVEVDSWRVRRSLGAPRGGA